MRSPQVEDATRVRYQRSNERRRHGEPIQVWKSEVTGREFEIRESRSYASTDELSPGAEGFLDFTTGSAEVTRRPLERSARLDRYYQRQLRSMRTEGHAGKRGRRLRFWLTVLALLAIVVWLLSR